MSKMNWQQEEKLRELTIKEREAQVERLKADNAKVLAEAELMLAKASAIREGKYQDGYTLPQYKYTFQKEQQQQETDKKVHT